MEKTLNVYTAKTDNYENIKFKKDLLIKAFGEINADIILLKMPILNHPIQSVIDYLKNKLPIKSTFNNIILNNASYLNKDYLESINDAPKNYIVDGSLENLLKKVNYEVEVVSSLNDALKYKKYYKNDELICTFRSNNRFDESYITFFKHKDIENTFHANDLTQDNLNNLWKNYLTSKGRKNSDGTFDLKKLCPYELDPYSKSLLSVQILKKGKNLKTISRYNHSISNPDYVYPNLDDIIDGLHHKFYDFFNETVPNISCDNIPDGYVLNSLNQLFKYDKEVNGNYYGDGFIIKSNGKTVLINKDNQLINDQLINHSMM